MTELMTTAEKLADVNDRLVASGRLLTHEEQILQARRHALWTARWLNLASSLADPAADATLPEAVKAIRRGRALIEQALA